MTIETELLALFDEDGILQAQTIVNWAKDNPESETYKEPRFYWDDPDKAINEHRLTVARSLIRIHILTDDGAARNTISLVQDRRTGGGYRQLDRVFSNGDMRRMALRQALRELRAWEARYKHLQELADIFEATASVGLKEDVAA